MELCEMCMTRPATRRDTCGGKDCCGVQVCDRCDCVTEAGKCQADSHYYE